MLGVKVTLLYIFVFLNNSDSLVDIMNSKHIIGLNYYSKGTECKYFVFCLSVKKNTDRGKIDHTLQ